MPLDKNEVLAHLQSGSVLFKKQPQFKERPEQIAMLSSLIESYNQKTFALIEAGTGVGKSLAYLLPTLIHCAQTRQKAVISTHTITLQEQLLCKDIPFLIEALNLDIEVSLVKGMGNYLCLRKLFDQLDHTSLQGIAAKEELLEIENWSQQTLDGSLSDLEKMPKHVKWDQLNCESDACSFVKCPYYKSCFFFKARKKSKDAQLLIANHHLLLADLQQQNLDSGQTGCLTDYEHLIIDEAHTLEDIATRALAKPISSQQIQRKLNDLIAERGGGGKLQRLKKALLEFDEEVDPKWIRSIDLELFDKKRELQTQLFDAFILLGDFLKSQFAPNASSIEKITLETAIRTLPAFEEIKHHFDSLVDLLKSYSTTLLLTLSKLDEIKHTPLKKKLQNILIDTRANACFLDKSAILLKDFFHPEDEKNKIYVLEWDPSKSFSAIRLLVIQLNVSEVLSNQLFAPRESGMLCSATLSHNKQFNFIRHQLGFETKHFEENPLIETILDSPFDYPNQVMLCVPSDIPEPRSIQYHEAACQNIQQALMKSHGGAFVLFTSYKMLSQCYDQIESALINAGLCPLKQGDENRATLLKIFKENENAVLFGTDTFWEGIDVPGFHLRMVIITKLPFPVPSEPLFQAKCQQIEKKGLNPFMNYSVPKAIVKFKQGFGRLIRTTEDFGCIVCLDSRLLTKAYGKLFLNSLPNCEKVFAPSETILQRIQSFYEKNWSVTESNR